ncbi:MAG: hypothetical protein EYC70_07225 [Planctomycetota bacterium]|nr:MAG: hypothetical protein EYC70_07225 [Planctomycetota bacterium]
MGWKHHAAPHGTLPQLRDGFPDGTVRATLVDRPTVRVQQLDLADGRRGVLKRYFFPYWSQRMRALHRHAWLGLPKPVNEARNLLRLSAAGVPALEPMAWAVKTSPLGIVRDGWLLLPYLDGARTLEQVLRAHTTLPEAFWSTLGAEVRRVHDVGCWYRNLAARNLLLTPELALHWIDPGKSQWLRAPLDSSRAAADLAVFLIPLQPFLPPGAWPAFQRGYGRPPAPLEDLWQELPRDLRRRCEHWVRREQDRLAAPR